MIEKTIGFRVSVRAEVEGIDIAEHAEFGYDLSVNGGSAGGATALVGVGASAARSVTPTAPLVEKVEPAGEPVAG